MELVDLLEKLSNACGVTGSEDEVRVLMKEFLKPNVDELEEDKLGNVIGIRRGKESAPKIMLAAHMDEVGLMVINITKDGFLQFTKLGGISDRILASQKVVVHSRAGSLPGVIGSKPPHILKEEERKKVIEAEDLYIDIGASKKEEVEQMGVRIGDPVSFDVKFTRMGKEMVMGKAFDDRVGCAVMIEAMRRLSESECTVCAVGTVQEEVGLRGATTAAFQLAPDLGIAIDVTIAGDVPGIKEVEAPIKTGNGPSLTVADASLITHPQVLKLLMSAAEESKIPFQLEGGRRGGTDAGKIALTKGGIPSGVISIPTRYIHTPFSVVNLMDVENTIKLAIASIKGAPKFF
jgi:putative aminopeptidase FrvX